MILLNNCKLALFLDFSLYFTFIFFIINCSVTQSSDPPRPPVKRKLSVSINPSCITELGTSCSSWTNVSIVHIRSDGPSDSLHFVWTFTSTPSLLLAITSLDSNLIINWNSVFSNAPSSLYFHPPPLYTSALVLNKIWVYNDPNDKVRIDKVNQSGVYEYDTSGFSWERQMSPSVINSTSFSITLRSNSYKSHSIGQNGTISLTIKAREIDGYSDILPYMLHNSNMTQVDINMREIQLNYPEPNPPSTRIALSFTLLQDSSITNTIVPNTSNKLSSSNYPKASSSETLANVLYSSDGKKLTIVSNNSIRKEKWPIDSNSPKIEEGDIGLKTPGGGESAIVLKTPSEEEGAFDPNALKLEKRSIVLKSPAGAESSIVLKSLSDEKRSIVLTNPIVSNSEPNMWLVNDKRLDDEHTPGVFSTWYLRMRRLSDYEESYMEWKPICYTDEKRDITDSVDVESYDIIESSFNLTEEWIGKSVLWAYYGHRLSLLTLSSFNVSFGTEKDGFYNKTPHISWTFMSGFGVPPADYVSPLVILVVSIGFGIPVLLIIISLIYSLVKKITRPRDDLLLGVN